MRNRTSEKRNQLPRSHGERVVGLGQDPAPFPCAPPATGGRGLHLLTAACGRALPWPGGSTVPPLNDRGHPLPHCPSAAGRTGAADVLGWRHPLSLVQSWSRFLKSSLQNWSQSLKVKAPVGAALKEEIPSEGAVLRTRHEAELPGPAGEAEMHKCSEKMQKLLFV